MSHFILLVALVAGAEQPNLDGAKVSRLIRQLGSETFAERETASKALVALGEIALEDLQAAKRNPDPEVRRRLTQVIKTIESQVAERARLREIESIKASKLSPQEKGSKLKTYLTIGMTQTKVEKTLGDGSLRVYKVSNLGFSKTIQFEDCGLWVWFSRKFGEADYRLVAFKLDGDP